jgi:tetratricopeptide (TPR) repeat protein
MRIHSSLPCLTLFVLAACAADRGGANSELAAPPADAALQSPAALSPKDSRTARAAAAEGLFQRQEWSAAAEAFEPLAREFPDDQRYWMRLGFARHSLGQYGASIAAFGQVQRGPALAHARYNIACGEALSGKPEAALEALESAVAAGFNDRATLAADQDLASLRELPRFQALLAKVGSAPVKFTPSEESRQFDFWIGEWDVVSPQGTAAGTSRIESILGGAAVMEHWTSAQGNSGKSFNRFDPTLRQWRQHWIDDSGNETFYVGGLEQGVMVLTSEQKNAAGKTELHRMRFFPLPDGRVRQWGEVSTDGGQAWTTEFDLSYRPAAAR